MSRFYTDDAGRVLERATGAVLGRVDCMRAGQYDAIYWARGACGESLRTTLIRDIAVLAVLCHARPGESFSLWDLHE